MRLRSLTFVLAILRSMASSVVQLQKLNFEPLVYRTDSGASRWFIKFYAPWCVHCRALQPVWEELAESADEAIRYGEVDCTSEVDLCSNFAVQGYPTLVLVDANTRLFETFSGHRTKDAIAAFANDAVFESAADASPTSTGGRATVAKAKKKLFEPNAKEKPIKEVPSANSEAKTNELPDEAQLGPPIRVPKARNFDLMACLDFGPFSRQGNMYFFGLPLIAGIYLGVYLLAGGRKREEEKKTN
eukprot:GEMP01071933.1.p1 GENE.GEMP01071933.1~~GEMP01071933.1.p1  ORF type:complete len:244 (+),score=43.66 GEMP01071933.1:75-806(+)